MLKTTLYNHKKAGTADNPLVPNIIFKSLVWLEENKFHEEFDFLYSKYSFTEFQRQFLKQITDKRIDAELVKAFK